MKIAQKYQMESKLNDIYFRLLIHKSLKWKKKQFEWISVTGGGFPINLIWPIKFNIDDGSSSKLKIGENV